MPNTPLYIKVPGKLMIAGEFAVLEPNQQLVVMAVDRFIYATLQPSRTNKLTLENFELNELPWHFSNDRVHIHSDDKRIHFVNDAMTIALTYLREQSIVPNEFTLTINSELDDSSGIKYGLGSSAAVVVSVISAILKKYAPEASSADLIFKLAAISHIKTQGNGSGADIAASVYGGLLQYSSFQADWLQTEYKNSATLTELLNKEWIYFSVEQLQLPKSIHMCVGWTGSPASTKQLVDKILTLKKTKPEKFQQFLTDSEQAVHIFLQGIKDEDPFLIFKGIKKNRHSLSTVGVNANVEIETPLLRELSDLAGQANGAGKLSGAGGGDCGIALVSSAESKQNLLQSWETSGIKPLAIDLYPQGAEVVQ